MNSLKRIFGGISTQYMVRAYVLGAIFFGLVVVLLTSGLKPDGAGTGRMAVLIGYFAICTLLFPFSKLVWDQLKAMALGETFLILPVIFLYPAKFIVNYLLWGFALFVAPFGMAYIWFKTKAA